MNIIKQLDDLHQYCGRDNLLQSELGGTVPLPLWANHDIAVIGPPKSKSVYILCTPGSQSSQSYFNAVSSCHEKRISIVSTVVVERSIIKMLQEDKEESAIESRTTTAADQVLFDRMLKEAVMQGVSDILIDNNNGRYNIKYDIDTLVQPVRGITRVEAESMMRHFYQNLADQDVVEDSVFSFEKAQFAAGDGIWSDQKIRIRYQSKPSFPEGCDFSLRLLNLSDAGGFSRYENLMLSSAQTKLLALINQSESGAIITAGITSSGKTTTNKVMIEEILRAVPGIQIRTAESPPEYIITGARQHHVGEDASGETDVYAETIKELMRMRPDKIYIGEIRSRQTAELFGRAVLSGHGVYTTIHTDSPYEIITRLEGEGMSRDVLSSGHFINGLIYQKRLPKLCGNCKVSYNDSTNTDLKERLKLLKSDLSGIYFHNEEGCTHCGGRGIKGSIVCMEIVRPNKAMRLCLKEKDETGFYVEWLKLGRRSGYGNAVETSLYHCLRNMVHGLISPAHMELRYGELSSLLLEEQTRTWSSKDGFGISLV